MTLPSRLPSSAPLRRALLVVTSLALLAGLLVAGPSPAAAAVVGTTTRVVERQVDPVGPPLESNFSSDISDDGRFVAFVAAETLTADAAERTGDDVYRRDLVTGDVVLVSRHIGVTGNGGGSGEPSISPDGRYVAFSSSANDLDFVFVFDQGGDVVLPDANGVQDVFVRDLGPTGGPASNRTTIASVMDTGRPSAVRSSQPSISGGGSSVAFQSSDRLNSTDRDRDEPDVYVRLRTVPGRTLLLSPSSTGAFCACQGHGQPSISDDGTRIAFTAYADDLTLTTPPNGVSGDQNGVTDVALATLEGATLTGLVLLSVNPEGFQVFGISGQPDLEAGRVAFVSRDPAVVGDPLMTGESPSDEVYVRNLAAGATERGSLPSPELLQDVPTNSVEAALDPTGRFVAFAAAEDNLVPDDNNAGDRCFDAGEFCVPGRDVFVRDLVGRRTERVSVADDGTQATFGGTAPPFSLDPALSAGARRVAFTSDADNLLLAPPGDTNGAPDVFLRGRLPRLAVTPAEIDFGAVSVGSEVVARITITNDGSGPADVADPVFSGPDGADLRGTFRCTTPASGCQSICPVTLQPGDTCFFTVVLKPSRAGQLSAQAQIQTSAGVLRVPLAGRGVAAVLVFEPDPAAFAPQPVGTPAPEQTVLLRNVGDAETSLVRVEVRSPGGDFTLVSQGCIVDGTLGPQEACPITIAHTPLAAGPRAGSVVVVTRAFDPSIDAFVEVEADGALIGRGLQAQLQVTPPTLDVGPTQVGGGSPPQLLTVTNVGDAPSRALGTTIAEDEPAFRILEGTDTCAGVLLGPLGACTVQVVFLPLLEGPDSESFRVFEIDGLQSATSRLSGTGRRGLLVFTPDPVDFGVVGLGVPAAPRIATLANVGEVDVTVAALGVGGTHATDFLVLPGTCADTTLAPGASCQVPLGHTPSTGGARSGTVTATGTLGESAAAALASNARAGELEVVPALIDFGPRFIGAPAPAQAAVVRNVGTVSEQVASVTLGGAAPGDFTLAEACVGAILAPAATCPLALTFTPTAGGSRTAEVGVRATSTGAVDVLALRGQGTRATLVLAPDPTDFGLVPVASTTIPRALTLSNQGDGPADLTGITVTGAQAGDFSLPAGGTCAATATLAPGASCTVPVVFRPGDAGARAARVEVASTAVGSPAAAAVTGVGGRPGIVIEPAATDFGEVLLGAAAGPRPVTVRSTGAVPLVLGAVMLGGGASADFAITLDACSGAQLAPGASCMLGVRFAPGAVGARETGLAITDNAPGAPHVAALRGRGALQPVVETLAGRLALTPDPVDLGGTPVGVDSAPRPARAQNIGTAPLTVTGVGLEGAQAGQFAAAGDGCAARVLAPGQSCDVTLRMRPSGTGARTATLRVDSSVGPQRIRVQGAGLAPTLTVTPAPLDLGVHVVASTTPAAPRTVTVRNTGSAPSTVSAVRLTGPQRSEFPVRADGCTGVTLAPGQSCTLSIVFAPADQGDRTAELTIDATGTDTPAPFAVRGRGLVPRVILEPPLGRRGFVSFVRGEDFPPGVAVPLTWDPGLGATVVTTAPDGTFRASLLVFRREEIGIRDLVATGDGFSVRAPYLVVAGPQSAPDFLVRS